MVKTRELPQAERNIFLLVLLSLPPTVSNPSGGDIPGAPPPKLLGLLDGDGDGGVDDILMNIFVIIVATTFTI